MNNPQSAIRNPQWRALLASLAFWLALFAATGLYALVALSPKLLTYLEQRQRWRENQQRLVQLERNVQHLQRVEKALRNDAEYAAELARVELDAANPGEDRIPVEDVLSLNMEASDQPVTQASQPLYADVVRRFAGERDLRNGTLLAAALIVVLAFGLLHPGPAPD